MSEWIFFAVSFTAVLLCAGLTITYLEFRRANKVAAAAELSARVPNKRIGHTRARSLNS